MEKMVRFGKEGSIEVKREGIEAVVFVGPGLSAKAYAGKSVKPSFYYRFTSQEQMDKHINEFFESLAKMQAEKQKRKAVKADFKTTLEVGQIVYSSWGYEQTNIDFYQVIEVSDSKKSVKLQELKKEIVSDGAISMTGRCVAMPNNFVNGSKPFIKKVQPGEFIRLNTYSGASKWDGNPKSFSTYG